MPDLAELGAELRVTPPVAVTPLEALRRRNARRRRRRLALTASALVLLAGAAAGLVAGRTDDHQLQVSTGPGARRHASSAPTAPSRPGPPLPAVGPVHVLEHGMAGATRWWHVAYDTVLGSPPRRSPCTLLVGDDGQPFTGAGGCSIPTDGRQSGSTLGFAHIAGHDFVSAETFDPIDSAEVKTRSGTILTSRALPIPGRTSTAWVIELPTTGDVKGYVERSQAVIERISTVSNGVRRTIYPTDPP